MSVGSCCAAVVFACCADRITDKELEESEWLEGISDRTLPPPKNGAWLSVEERPKTLGLTVKLLLILKPDIECLSFTEEVRSAAKACRVKCLVLAAPKMAISSSITTT